MRVAILCGGMGTRLREETEYRPKPLVDIGGRPIIWHIMKTYAHYGFRSFVLCLGYKGEMFKEYFLNYEAMNNDFTICLGGGENKIQYHGAHREQDFQVTLVDTGLNSQTGKRIKLIERHIQDDTFLITYGDGLANIDLRKLMDFHASHGKLATVTMVKPYSRYGVLEVDRQDRVRRFAEKPQVDGWVSTGFFVFNRKLFEYIPPRANCVLEQEPLSLLAQEGQLMAYRHEGFFYAMDTYREYLYLNDLWVRGEAPWKVWKE